MKRGSERGPKLDENRLKEISAWIGMTNQPSHQRAKALKRSFVTVAAIAFGGLIFIGCYDMGTMLLDCHAARSRLSHEMGRPLKVTCSKNWGARIGWGRSENLVVSVRIPSKPGSDPAVQKERVKAIVAEQFRDPVDRVDVFLHSRP